MKNVERESGGGPKLGDILRANMDKPYILVITLVRGRVNLMK